MAKNMPSWGRESIISMCQQQMQGEKKQKGCTLPSGNTIQGKQCLKGISFTIKMVIAITTTIAIWSAYRVGNIIRGIANGLKRKIGKHKTCGGLQLNGTNPKLDELGINFKERNSRNSQSIKCAHFVEKNSTQNREEHSVQGHAQTKAVDVYNLKVKDAGCYYANGILVSNCDAFSMAVSLYKDAGGRV